MNKSLAEMKKPETLLDRSNQQFENSSGKTLMSINNGLNHLLKTNHPSSSTVITSTSSSTSSDWLKCQNPTPTKSKSSLSSSTTPMSSSHKWLNANDTIEQNKSNTSDSQVNNVIRTKFLSNGISNNINGHQKSYRTHLPTANLGLQFSTISDRTKCSNLKQSHINITSKLDDTNKSNHETITSTKYTPFISHNRQRLIPQHLLSRLKSLKEINNGENYLT
ncbi:unnamed protein product [Schistosoma spindalis]|nr:unnamed protein product [Schistosoma spindale]